MDDVGVPLFEETSNYHHPSHFNSTERGLNHGAQWGFRNSFWQGLRSVEVKNGVPKTLNGDAKVQVIRLKLFWSCFGLQFLAAHVFFFCVF